MVGISKCRRTRSMKAHALLAAERVRVLTPLAGRFEIRPLCDFLGHALENLHSRLVASLESLCELVARFPVSVFAE
jgi:hypothetical protein